MKSVVKAPQIDPFTCIGRRPPEAEPRGVAEELR